MTGDDYNIVLLSFFITYVLFEVPSNLVSCILSLAAGTDGFTAANEHDHRRSSNASDPPSTSRPSWASGASQQSAKALSRTSEA
jgi:hypothetical protein